jgi:glycosyltransferase involved in cell wall biosynthesis
VGALGCPPAVVIGPARDPLPGVSVVSHHDAPLPLRLRAFARAVTATDIDVVDAHFALYAVEPAIFGAARHLPLVVHFHGPWAREAAAEAPARSSSTAARRALERAVYRRAQRVITLSGAFGRVLVHEYGVDPWRIEIIRPGVDLERFRPGNRADARETFALDAGARIVVTVRRLVARTGVDTLLDAWSSLDDDAALVIAGDGPERPRLVEQARRLGLRHVRFLGPVADEDLPTLYRAADVCAVPSMALEGFGLVVLEALASGTPVLVTDVGGLPEAVAGLGHELVVPAGDAAALAERVASAFDGGAPLPSAAACRAHAESFSWADAAVRHRAVYADAITPPVRPRGLYVDHCARLSGGEIALLRTVRALTGTDAHVVTFEDGPLLAELGAAGITTEVVALPARTRDLRRAQLATRLPWRAAVDSLIHVGRLARRFRQLRPDVVHTNSLKASVLGGIAARVARVPCVWHVRDHIDTDALPRPAVSFVRALARRVPTAIVANSESTLASLHLPGGVGPLQVVIPDPVPEELFGAAATGAPDADPVVGIVGRLAPWKGQHVFLDAFARAFPAGGAHAHVVGEALFGEEDYRDALHEQAARLGIADRVSFRGFRADVRAELEALDVLVHASVQAEPFGQVVVEGMAAGLAVVATDAGGPAEIITPEHDGMLVPPDDPDALATVLRALVGDPARRTELGRQARVAAQRFRTDVVVPRFTALYEEMRVARC